MANGTKVFGSAIIRDCKFTIAIVSINGQKLIKDDIEISHDFAEEKIENEAGILETILSKRAERKISFNAIPKGATFTEAKASASLPSENEVITITDCTAPILNGTYNAKSGNKLKLKKAGAAGISVTAESYDDGDGNFAALEEVDPNS